MREKVACMHLLLCVTHLAAFTVQPSQTQRYPSLLSTQKLCETAGAALLVH